MTSEGGNITAEEVIGKLKDDGDFDTLRLKIIRKLKENEVLRNNIISTVKESAAFNRLGAENMKPRQLSDAIYQEIGENVMAQISDGLWAVIRSEDGMKNEIAEAVESVYNQLSNPKGKEPEENLPSPKNQLFAEECNGSLAASPHKRNQCSDGEPNEPPGFSLSNHHEEHNWEQHKEFAQLSKHSDEYKDDHQLAADTSHTSDDEPPGFGPAAFHGGEIRDNLSDEDPDVPPGFG
ncbi:hypothetical protein H6P81_014686 [Aristolochia fimbriata]|uniref:Uncharacterized protein n=1 Tax=Aristolochia fimbriata TaxID=158543 RepID=A0AAV7E4M2_ARIFI|nr:hypothetical protein H6P81_014686 [Aristolochia fimbriata]